MAYQGAYSANPPSQERLAYGLNRDLQTAAFHQSHSKAGFNPQKENIYPHNGYIDPRHIDGNFKYQHQHPSPTPSFQAQPSSADQKSCSVTIPPVQISNGVSHGNCIQSKISEPATQISHVDRAMLLLSLADEYFANAYSLGSSPGILQEKNIIQDYYKLIAGGLRCLETVLEKCQIQPEQEATIRLRYATILYEETEELMEAEESLNKGIAIAARHKLFDLKYNMQHLLVRILFQSRASAALKFLDGVIKDAEAYQHVAWTYAFRFQKASLHMELGHESNQDIKAALTTLKSIASTAEIHSDTAILAIVLTMEASLSLKVLKRSERFEEAQRLLASVRSSQSTPAVSSLPQLNILAAFVDLTCYLQHYDPKQALQRMQFMQNAIATISEASRWMEDGSFSIPLSKARMPYCARKDGIVRIDDKGSLQLMFNWMPKDDIYNIGYLMSGIALAHRNSLDGQKSEQMLHEGIKRELYAQRQSDKVSRSIISSTCLQLWRQHLSAYMHLQLAFTLLTRSLRDTAEVHIKHLSDASTSWSTKPRALGNLIDLLLATYHQGAGRLDAALSCYERLLLTNLEQGSYSHQVATDAAVVATLNYLLMIRNPKHPNHHRIEILSQRLIQHCPHHSNRQIQSAFNLVNATLPKTTTILGTKQSLHLALEAAKATQNNQLMCMVLNIMSWKFFRGVVGEQAENSARASQAMAKRVGDRLWVCLSAGVIWEHLEAAGKNKEAEACWQEGCQAALSLPLDVRKVLELEENENTEDVRMQEAC